MDSVGKSRNYPRQLSIEQITKLSDYCLQNASELVEEARLLFRHKRYARAFFLSMLALEETSKRDILWQAIFLGEDEKQWGKFWDKFTSHKTKLARMLKDYVTVNYSGDKNTILKTLDEYFTKIKGAELEAKEFDMVKQWALYVDIVDGEATLPSRVINRQSAFKMLKLAKQHLEQHRRFKPTARELEANLSLKKEMKEGESFIDYWRRTHGGSKGDMDSQ